MSTREFNGTIEQCVELLRFVRCEYRLNGWAVIEGDAEEDELVREDYRVVWEGRVYEIKKGLIPFASAISGGNRAIAVDMISRKLLEIGILTGQEPIVRIDRVVHDEVHVSVGVKPAPPKA